MDNKIEDLLAWLVAQLNARPDVEACSRVDGEDAVGVEIDGLTYFIDVKES